MIMNGQQIGPGISITLTIQDANNEDFFSG